jgi:hypothetical protein
VRSAAISTLAVALAVSSTACAYRGSVASGITAASIVRITPGTSYDQLLLTFGQPLEMERWGTRGWEQARDPLHGRVLLRYSKSYSMFAPIRYPMVFVVLDEGRVTYVKAEVQAPFPVGSSEIFMTPSPSDPKRPWNFLKADTNRQTALAELYAAFGQ